jgi:hypothetical protein
MRVMKIPDTPETRAALNAVQVLRLVLQSPYGKELLRAKCSLALQVWAVRQTGSRLEDVLAAGFWDFLQLVVLCLARLLSLNPNATHREVLGIIEHVPLSLPPSVPADGGLPYRVKGKGFWNVSDASKKYREVLARVKEIKRKTHRSRAARKLAFVQELRPTTPVQAEEYLTMKTSDIAYDYLARLDDLPVKGAAVKKLLQLHQHPERMIELALREMERRYGSRTRRRD